VRKIYFIRLFLLFFLQIFLNLPILAGELEDNLALAKKAYSRNEFARAISFLDAYLKEKSNSAAAWLLRGKCNIEMDQYNSALDDLNNAYTINPQESEYLFLKGLCEWKLKRVSACVNSIEKSLTYSPDNLFAYQVLGSLYFELDMILKSKDYLDKAINIRPDFSSGNNSKKLDNYMEFYKISLRAAVRDSKNNPTDFKPYFYKGVLKAIVGDNWGAFLEFEQGAKMQSIVPIFYYYKAFVEYNISKYDLALIDLGKYQKGYPADESIPALISTIKESNNLKLFYSQESETGEVLTFAEQMPEFKGGINEMYAFLSQNIKYPKIAMAENIEGKVVISFVVDDKGNVGKIQVMKAIGGGCEEEAIRVIQSMPKWNPGKQNGKPVSVRYTLPISFKLADSEN
jgi:TonB family protein